MDFNIIFGFKYKVPYVYDQLAYILVKTCLKLLKIGKPYLFFISLSNFFIMRYSYLKDFSNLKYS